MLDVKTGAGAFMKTLDDSFALAKEMVDIGTNVGRNTIAIVSDMDEPLGFAVGNALEVKEAIDTLKGKGPKDLYELCMTLGSYMLILAKKADNVETAREILEDTIRTGAALNKFKEFVAAQGGDPEVIDNPELLPKAEHIIEFKAEESGYVNKIVAIEVGLAALVLGAGRETKESQIDLAVGVVLNKKVGDYVEKGEPLAYIHVNDMSKLKDCEERLKRAFQVTKEKPEHRPLIFGVVTKEGIQRY